MNKFADFKNFLSNLSEASKPEPSLEDEKKELLDFIQGLDQETFSELMDVISSIMMDPLTIGDEDDHTDNIEGDEDIKKAMDNVSVEDIADEVENIDESTIQDLLSERGTTPASERLAAARNKRRDPRIKRMMKIKNAWIKKCKKRNLAAHKMETGKWGCGKVDRALAVLAKRWQHNRQKSVKVD